ncbi:hypothetical protein [Methyloferula stellata]|uniref:hypothetical protein n=1 Tax=Methyloferula stellata TaxID=876270 RepID=UPI00137630EC|nr:hypothetical protein [Methyloferula stellata]
MPRVVDAADAYRLFLAEELLDQGTSPRALMKALGFDTAALDLIRYDPNQPRVPAGNGRESGRWGSGGEGNAASGADRPTGNGSSVTYAFLAPTPAAEIGARTFLAGATSTTIRALAVFASRFFMPTAVLGALFIPTPNSGGITEGTLPDEPDIHFKKDGPAGTLRITTKAADGSDVFVMAHSRNGLYVDARTDQPIGRDLGEQLYFDFDAVHDALRAGLAPGQRLASDPNSEPKDDDPKLCPEAERDTPHGSSEKAKDYEDDVHARVNPLAPLPREFGVNLLNPFTGRMVFFEDCFRYAGDLIDGDMQKGDLVEAKGPRYAALIRAGGKLEAKVRDEFLEQAQKQLHIAQARGVGLKWYFAEKEAADYARDLFEKNKLGDIVVATCRRGAANDPCRQLRHFRILGPASRNARGTCRAVDRAHGAPPSGRSSPRSLV